MTAIETAIQDIRNITRIYDQFANEPQWFIGYRAHSIIISLTSVADTVTKLNTSNNYKQTVEEDNYWQLIFVDVKLFADKLLELIQDPQEYHSQSQWIEPLLSALMTLYIQFAGRMYENVFEYEEEELD